MTQNILLQFQKYTVLGKSLEFQGMHLLGLKMACHLLSSDGCNNPPDLVEGLHAGDARAATAAPLPSSAALQTEHAWPEADELQTSEELGPAALVDTLLQIVGGAASHDHEEDR